MRRRLVDKRALFITIAVTAAGKAGSQMESPEMGPYAMKDSICRHLKKPETDITGILASSIEMLWSLSESVKEPTEDVSSPDAVEAISSRTNFGGVVTWMHRGDVSVRNRGEYALFAAEVIDERSTKQFGSDERPGYVSPSGAFEELATRMHLGDVPVRMRGDFDLSKACPYSVSSCRLYSWWLGFDIDIPSIDTLRSEWWTREKNAHSSPPEDIEAIMSLETPAWATAWMHLGEFPVRKRGDVAAGFTFP